MCAADEFIVETVVSSNEMLSDDSTMARPFGESSYSAVVATKEHSSGGLHNAYVAVGTFATAIVIVVAVVSVHDNAANFGSLVNMLCSNKQIMLCTC